MERSLEWVVGAWSEAVGLCRSEIPTGEQLGQVVRLASDRGPVRKGVSAEELDGWEHRFGFRLPPGLRVWLSLSDGLYTAAGTLIHPLCAVGPMVPFARVPEVHVQPESWFEIGNPGDETVCIDLGYTWSRPRGGCPLFSSGDDQRQTRPRLIAPGFVTWLARVLREGGRRYWLASGFEPLGDPWVEHRHHAPVPPLPARLDEYVARAVGLMSAGADELAVAQSLGLTRTDVETLFRHLQHAQPR